MAGYLGNIPSAVPLTSADIADGIITSAKIADGTIVNADINASSAIALSKLSTTGTADATTFLRGDGAYTAVSSDFVLLATTDASSSASVSFDGYFSATYKNYIIIGSYVLPATDGAIFRLRYRRSNADITSSNYRHVIDGSYHNTSDANNNFVQGASGSSSIRIINDAVDSNTSNGGVNFNMTLYNPLNANSYKYCTWQNSYIEASGTQWFTNNGTGLLVDSTSALSGLSFSMDTGNITSGNFKLYGIK